MAISKAISKQLGGNNVESDETYTPEYVVDFLDKHICHLKKTHTIWCPFSNNPNHAFVKRLTELGYKVKWNKNNNDFFAYDKESVRKLKVDAIIDNPPFSIKDQVLAQSFALGLPFIYILPLDALGGAYRNELYRKYDANMQALIPDTRIWYKTRNSHNRKSPSFHSFFLSDGLFMQNLIFDTIKSYEDDTRFDNFKTRQISIFDIGEK